MTALTSATVLLLECAFLLSLLCVCGIIQPEIPDITVKRDKCTVEHGQYKEPKKSVAF